MSIKTQISATMNGSASRAKTSTRMPVMLMMTNITMPTGGVIRPIIRLRTITRPKWTGSMPTAVVSGVSTGTSTTRIATASMMQPRSSSRTLIISSTAQGQRLRNRLAGQDPGEERTGGDDQHQPSRLGRHLDQDRPDVAQGKLAQEERADQEGVGRGHDRGLGGREHAREDAAQDDNGQ